MNELRAVYFIVKMLRPKHVGVPTVINVNLCAFVGVLFIDT
jgi:hypothetical protein